MGWAREHLGLDRRLEAAKELFQVTEESGSWLNGHCPLHDEGPPGPGRRCHFELGKPGSQVWRASSPKTQSLER
ncbi:hypothetical protein AKJ60_00290 [candidate division MSBL1 archaeon SCGC-AAA385M11]|nr:hypothetical protein AKJ60_00290 [candidate division MSBL1 archaeon SCGC-AAA385M11]